MEEGEIFVTSFTDERLCIQNMERTFIMKRATL